MSQELFCRYVEAAMVEYSLCFPYPQNQLHHMLFVVGNGYEVDPGTGLPCHDQRIADQYVTVSILEPINQQTVIDRTNAYHQQENQSQQETMSRIGSHVDLPLYPMLTVADWPTVTGDNFTVDSLYQDIINDIKDYIREYPRLAERGISVDYIRPYPLSTEYSAIFKLNQNTPQWFVSIAANLCAAWTKVLSQYITNQDVDIIKLINRSEQEVEEAKQRIRNVAWAWSHIQQLQINDF